MGENLYASSGSATAENALYSWYAEVSKYTYPGGFSSGTGHYTQVVWAKSLRVGCSISRCTSIQGLSWGGTIIGCRYYPGGNYNNQPPYESSDRNCNTCAAMGYQCGEYTNNCSESVTCNSCNDEEKCINHICYPKGCSPKTTCPSDYECGTENDGCGWFLGCGSCPVGKKCNPNNHKCMNCTARTKCSYG